MADHILSQSELHQILHYDQDTGIFTRKTSNSKRHVIGKIAGSCNVHGYIAIMVLKKIYTAHRLAWLYVYGEWPLNQIDHINGEKTDNRICNLRQVTPGGNNQNIRKPKSGNKSGFLGVSWHKIANKYRAEITLNYKNIYLGLYPTAELAHQAYLEAKRKLHDHGTL